MRMMRRTHPFPRGRGSERIGWLLDDDFLNDGDFCVGAESTSEVFSFFPRLILVVGLDQQAHLLAAVTDTHIVPLTIEQARLFAEETFHCCRAAVFVHQSLRLWVRANRFVNSCRQVAGLEGGNYQQKLFEGHAEMPKSSLAKEKRIEVKDLVADCQAGSEPWLRSDIRAGLGLRIFHR